MHIRQVLKEPPSQRFQAERKLEHNSDLFEMLRMKRKELAQRAGVPPYVIFSDKTLIEMAASLPENREQLIGIHGIGEVKLQRYGEVFLDIIKAYCAGSFTASGYRRPR